MKVRDLYVNTTISTIGFVAFLTFGFVWATIHPNAPFAEYRTGLVVALATITGKRLAQKWEGKGKGFRAEAPPKKTDEDAGGVPWR